MATVINVGTRYVLDETIGLQTNLEDDDVAVATLPAVFSSYLFTTLGLSNGFAVANGAAHSSTNVITVTSPGPVSALTLHDGTNGTLDGDDSGLTTIAGNKIFLYATSNPHIVIGREGTGSTANAAGDVVFAVYLDSAADNKTATLWTVQFEAISNPDATNPDDVVDLGNHLKIGATGDLNLDLASLQSGQLLFGAFGDIKDADADAEVAVIVIARDQSTTDGDAKDTVNTSKGGGAITIGISNQMFNPGEGAYFTFVTGVAGTIDSKGQATLISAGANDAPAAIAYDGVYGSAGASFKIVQIQGAGNNPTTNVKISAFVTAPEQGQAFIDGLTNDTQLDISLASVRVFVGGVDVTASVTVIEDGLSVKVEGVPVGATVRYETTGGVEHNRVLIENVNGNNFDIGGFALVGQPTYAFIGQAIGFGDDGPSTILGLTAATAAVDETTLANDTTVLGSALFTSTDSFGTDGAGAAAVYSLQVAAGGASGLSTSETNQAITLYVVVGTGSTQVEGRYGAGDSLVAFRVTINSGNGNVTLNQIVAIEHPNASNPDDAIAIAAGRLLAVRAVTDGDGDSASASADIGTRMVFADDGPATDLTLEPGQTVTVDETSLTTDVTVNGALLFNWTDNFGADGAGTGPVYSLQVAAGGVSGLSTSTTNQAITLFQVNPTTVEGRFGAGLIAFVVTIDGSSGDVTLDQRVAIEHPTTDPNEALSIAAGVLLAVRAITDGDGDGASDPADLGPALVFRDDGPSVTLDLKAGVPVMVDESNLAGDTTVTGLLLFDKTVNFGADNVGTSSVYSLDVGGGGVTSLFTSDHQAITLVKVGATVEGQYGAGLVAFVVTIDGAAGDVKLDQKVALEHPLGGNPDDSVFIDAGVLFAVLTVTDGDGDTNSDPADIGPALEFQDDGPVAAISLTANRAITDESSSPPAGDGGFAAPSDDDGKVPTLTAAAELVGYASTSLVTAAASQTGADGGGAVSFTLALSGAGADSLLDTTDGSSILLYQESSTLIVGRTVDGSGEAIFAISINGATGAVTVEQYDSIRHTPSVTADDLVLLGSGLISAVATQADTDTDSSSAAVDLGGRIGFEDDGPAVTLALNNVTLVVDQSVGADVLDPNAFDEAGQPAGVIGYAAMLGADLFTTSYDHGEDQEGSSSAFTLLVNSTVTGLFEGPGVPISLFQLDAQTVQGRYSGTNVAFTIHIDAASGDVSFTQFHELQHNDSNNSDESLALGSNLISAIRTITDGDGDSASASVDLGAIMAIEDDGPSIAPPPAGETQNLQVGNTVGATDSGHYTLDGGTDFPATFNIIGAPDSNGLTFRYADVNHDGTIGQNEIIGTLGTVDLYSLFVDSGGDYDFTLLSRVPGSTTKLDLADIKAGGPDTNFIDVGALNTTDFVRISGFYNPAGPAPNAPAAVNESHFNVGVINGNLDAGETLEFSLYDALGVTRQDISGISIGTKTARTTSYTYTAYDNGNAVTGMVGIALTVAKNGTIVINAPSGVFFDTVDLVSVDGNAVKIGLGDIEIRRLPPDYVLDFDLRLTDADGDHVDTSFLVSIDGNGDGQITAPILALQLQSSFSDLFDHSLQPNVQIV